MPRRLSSSTLTTLLAATIAWPSSAAAHVRVAPGLPAALATSQLEESASLLGLESDDAAAGAALTKALRKAAAKRGLGGGPEMSLVEMRLTMGCETNSEACLAEGGKAIEVRQLIYGELRKSSGGYKVQLYLLDVGSAGIASNTTVPLSAADLSPDKIDATAAKVIQSLLPKETDDEPLPATTDTPVVPETQPETTPEPDKPPRQKKYEWGREKPAPRWKKIGLGVTAGVGGAALIAGVVMAALLRTKLRDDLFEAVDKSQDDDGDGVLDAADMDDPDTEKNEANVANNIYRSDSDLCETARFKPNPNAPTAEERNAVRNAAVTGVCNRADGIEKAQFAAFGAGAVLGVAAIAFTVLLFVHKRKGSEGAAALLRHDFKLSAAPTFRGGAQMGIGFRF
ncbi:MAG: hypothetical protein JNK45_10210 [Myxococcales bacterium]|nr:hypothetical protein [Myxococcales bacterium]